jgi:hypothetical protein
MTERNRSSVTNHALAASKWSLSFGGKLFSIVPFYTILVIGLTLVSQISMLLAFFLPLKVLLLLGSTDIPGYFRDLYGEIGRNELVVVLASGSAIFYLIFLFAERLVILFTRRASSTLLDKSRKITLFHNQAELASRTYGRYSRSLAGLVFIVSALLIIFIVYPSVAAALLLEIIISFLIVTVLFEVNETFRAMLTEGVDGVMKVVGAMGFLLAFFFMLVDALLNEVHSIIILIISLLLIRQLMNRLGNMVVDLTALYKQRMKINALFFHGKKLYEVTHQLEAAFWSLFTSEHLDIWIPDLMLSMDEAPIETIRISWRPSGIVNVVLLSFSCNSAKRHGTYFLKIFNKGKAALTLHEETLMSACGGGQSPFPYFIGSRLVQDYHCHVFYIAQTVQSRKSYNTQREAISQGLLTFDPPAALLESYVRSRPQLDQRLNSAMLERLKIVAYTQQHQLNLSVLEKKLPEICKRLRSLPLKLFNSDSQPEMIFFSTPDIVHFLHWGNWSVEPVGAGWPSPGKLATDDDWKKLDNVIDGSSIILDTVAGNFKDNVRLAGLMYSFERFYSKQRYLEAITLVPTIIAICKFSDTDNL